MGASQSSVTWYNLGEDGGGAIKGTFYTEKECYIRALELDPKYSTAWSKLGFHGGGAIKGAFYTPKECYIQALELDPKFFKVWYNLGVRGGGAIKGTFYTEKECYIRALELDPKYSAAWYNLGVRGGGAIKGTFYTEKECYIRALELDPKDSMAWYNLGVNGGGAIKGTFYTEKECYMCALELNPNDADYWYNLGVRGGGAIKGTFYTPKECYMCALELNPNDAQSWFNAYDAGGITWKGQSYDQKACLQQCVQANPRYAAGWACLALLGGGRVAGEEHSEARCLERAMAPDADFKTGFEGRRAPWMSHLIIHITSAQSAHQIEFIPTKGYKPKRRTAVSFPGKFGLAWDLVQGRGTEQARLLLEKFDLGDILGMGELNTCCVFLPKGSKDFGKHRAQAPDHRCWCSMPFSECGLEYILDGLPKNCKPNDVEHIHTSNGDVFRTNFGCRWYDRWIEKVENAVAADADLVAIVPDEGEPGNSQKGEMNFLRQRGYHFETMKLSDFIFELRSFV